MKNKKGDKVKILAGKNKGKVGTVSKSLTQINKVIVDGINIIKRHNKPKKKGEKGVIVEVSAPINVSNVKKEA
ncbi:MAG: 50S ribosomal protein L24 [Candidatus Pacebacteria bacterium]|nr:50S ribosomal protein L24 [Candidatus Paceibacterota bacterium]